MEGFFSLLWIKHSRCQPELLILLFGRTRTWSFSSKILRFAVSWPLTLSNWRDFSLHLCTLTRNWQIPGLVRRCCVHWRTRSTHPARTVISSFNQTQHFGHPEELFRHKASQLKALKKIFFRCCLDTDLHGGRVGSALVLRCVESSLTECGGAAERRHHRAAFFRLWARGLHFIWRIC